MFTKIAIVAALATVASAVGKARIVNECAMPFTIWSVGNDIAGPWKVDGRGGVFEEEFRRDPISGGIALKLTGQPDGLYTGKPEIIFAYTLDGDNVWFDLSDLYGDLLNGAELVAASSRTECQEIRWEQGVPPAGSQVKQCRSDADVTLTLCASANWDN